MKQNSNVVIQVEHLSKKYRIGGPERHWTLRDSISDFMAHPFGIGKDNQQKQDFWALDDVSFEVKRGDVVGVIGRNGSGKSTLLKILSRIVEPTNGKVTMKGRVASLLEVGTGFNPELTGRENIYLNGAILGMGKKEIDRKFDEIVAFSGVEKFIDTPVKRYSSGMYVRLAFAVAAHLDSDILLVDEVLAVGDLDFQKKSLGKMRSLAKSGKTVLFVSHSISAVKSLCNKSVLLDSGVIRNYSVTEKVIEAYLNPENPLGIKSINDIIATLKPDPIFKLNRVKFLQNDREITSEAENGKPLTIEVSYSIKEVIANLRIYIDLTDGDGNLLLRSFNDEMVDRTQKLESGNYRSRIVIPGNFLAPTKYDFVVGATIFNERSCLGDKVHWPITFINTGLYNKSYPSDPCRAKLAYHIPWENERIHV